MNCTLCKDKAVMNNLCKEHFIRYFEDKVKKTIKDYNLIEPGEKVVVAASGGKDSTAILYLLKDYNITALAIDEGIEGYRDKTLVDLKRFCKKHNIKLNVYSFEKEVGKRLDTLNEKLPCSTCGTFRRKLLNKYAEKYDKIATGHNLDDESQAILMNLFKGNKSLMGNSNPISSRVKGLTQRIKPLYFCSEKEVAAYAILKGFDIQFTECPYISKSFRHIVRDALNKYEAEHPGTKLNIVNHYLKNHKKVKKEFKYCIKCGAPSSGTTCRACQLKLEVVNV